MYERRKRLQAYFRFPLTKNVCHTHKSYVSPSRSLSSCREEPVAKATNNSARFVYYFYSWVHTTYVPIWACNGYGKQTKKLKTITGPALICALFLPLRMCASIEMECDETKPIGWRKLTIISWTNWHCIDAPSPCSSGAAIRTKSGNIPMNIQRKIQ